MFMLACKLEEWWQYFSNGASLRICAALNFGGFSMQSIAGASRLTHVIVAVLVIATPGCIIVPIGTSVSGSIETSKLESLVGSTKAQVIKKIGKPTYLLISPKMGESYYLYEFDISTHSFLGGLRPAPVVLVFPDGRTLTQEGGKLCYLLAFDADQSMVRFETRDARSFYSPKDSQGEESWPNDPNSDCRQYMWNPDQLSGITGIDFRKPTEDVALLKDLASGGDPVAAIALAQRTGELAPLRTLASTGNPTLAYRALQQLTMNSETLVEAWKWLCVDANSGDGLAQQQIGFWYRTWVKKHVSTNDLQRVAEETGIRPDKRIAYMWYTLADSNGNSDALRMRGHIVRYERMTKGEIAQAEQMARDWKPGDCPSAEHRLGPPGKG